MTKEREYSSGRWVDKDGNVVDSEPEEGHLLVRPGAVMTPERRAAVERAEANAPAKPEPVDEAQPVEAATEPEDVETAAEPDVSPKPRGKR